MARFEDATRTPIVLGERYRLVRQVNRDQSTETWEALDTRLERSVLLRLLAEGAQHDLGAQTRLRAAARQSLLSSQPEAPRVLDGGDDPIYGPFVIAELNRSMQATEPLLVVDSAGRAQGAVAAGDGAGSTIIQQPGRPIARPTEWQPRRSVARPPRRTSAGLLALAAVVAVVVAGLAFVIRAFGPSSQSSVGSTTVAATSQPARPLSGAPAGQPTAAPTAVATLAATAQPTSAPTIQPAATPPQPTAAPTARVEQPIVAPTTSPTRPATIEPTTQPTAASQAGVAGSPVDTIHQHYALINAKRYADGYNLMDANLRSLNSPADYASWFANKVSIEPLSIDLVSQAGNQAVVRSVVQTTDRVNGQNVTSQVSEQFVMRAEDGAWRIDQVTRV